MTTLQSTCIFCNKKDLISCSVKINWSGGNINFFFGLSSNPTTPPEFWEEVTGLISGSATTYTFINSRPALFYKIVKDYDTKIETQIDATGRMYDPAITIANFITE